MRETFAPKGRERTRVGEPRASRRFLPHIPELDGIRGLAILLVVVYHYFFEPAVVRPGSNLWHAIAPLRLGWTGVDLFFVLSGFLIGGILLDARGASNFFRTFYIRRFYRIVPIYAVLLGLCFFITFLVKRAYIPEFTWMTENRLPWTSYLCFGQNIWMAVHGSWGSGDLRPTWSLAVEEQFYLTLPIVIWFLETRLLRKVLVGIVAGVPVLRTILWILLRRMA